MSERTLRVVASSVHAWTQVPPDTSVVVRFDRPVDPRSAQSGFRLLGEDNRAVVRVSADGLEATWTPRVPPAEGEHTLLVEDVVTRERDTAVVPWRLPFVVAAAEDPSRPYGQVLLHSSTARLRMSSARYRISKLLDPRTGARRQVALEETGAVVDLGAIRREDGRRYAEKYGKLHPALFDKVERAAAEDRIPVALWMRVDEEPVDKRRFELDPCAPPPEELVAYRVQIRVAGARLTALLRKRFDLEVQSALAGAPVLLLELTPAQVRELARLDEVALLFFHETGGVDDVKDSMAISGADVVVNLQGWRGTGARVAVWEAAPDDESQLVISDHFAPVGTFTTQHARLVTGIIKHRALPWIGNFDQLIEWRGGYAPDCRIFSANSYLVQALDWAVGQKDCRVINQSFHRPDDARRTGLSLDDALKDYLAIHYPYPTIVQAAGEIAEAEPAAELFVSPKGYNSLRVGNHNDTATATDGGALTGNPPTPNGDRELPELCANGTAVKAVGITQNNTGTSFAAAAVSGSVALLHQMAPALQIWPEGVRAILLAGAGNVTGRTWWRDLRAGVDAADGAGALDIEESGAIAKSRVGPDSPGEPRGWDVGAFERASFDASDIWRRSYRVRAPELAGGRVKVALAWNSVAPWGRSGTLVISYPWPPADYDLLIYDGDKLVAWSASWDNNYEIAEFWGEAGKTYTIRIYLAPDDPSDERLPPYPKAYGIAWTVRSIALLPYMIRPKHLKDYIRE
jgi:hypothetical protein